MKKTRFLILLMCLMLLGSTALAETSVTAGMMAGIKTEQYPVASEPVTYTAMMANNYITGDPNDSMPVFKLFTEITGVQLDWTVISNTDLATQKALLLASGEIPDVSFGVFDDSDVLAYGPLGMFLPYEEYIDTKMPNLKYMMEEVSPDLRKSLTFSDGHIYTLPKLGAPNVPSTVSAYINQVWLNELGLEVPATTDELFDVLVAFKENAGKGSIPENVIPLSWNMTAAWTQGALNAWFGVTTGEIIKDGVVGYSPYNDGWKDMVQWINKCWDAGLMDIELFTQDNATFVAKGQEGLYGVTQTYTAAQFLKLEMYDDYTLLPALNGRALRQRPRGNYTVLNKGVVSSGIKDPELLMAALDLLWDSDFNYQVIWGPFGIVTEIDAEGNYRYMDNIPPAGYATLEEWTRTFHWNQLPGGMVYTDKNDSVLQSYDRLIQYKLAELYEGHWINDVMIYSFQTPEESETLNGYLTDLQKYVDEQYALWVTGERDVETDWESYKAELEKLHVKEYIAAYQAYYDRVMGK